jgi:exopolysaccharide biosynthesis predicted pyruvyltransferase EpsI
MKFRGKSQIINLKRSDSISLNSIRIQTMTTLARLLPEPANVALHDFPSHENVGDSMIWAGETQYLKDSGHNVRYVSDRFRFNPTLLRKLHPDGPILLHGGGNFGDIWPAFQLHREEIVAEFPDRKIIQLPQTVYFTSQTAATRANKVLGQHADFTLLVRDHESLERARLQLPDVSVVFCPDMAFGWKPNVAAPKTKRERIIVLERRDIEASGGLAKSLANLLSANDQVIDWGIRGMRKAWWSFVRLPAVLAKRLPLLARSRILYVFIRMGYRLNLRQNLGAGLRAFSQSKFVVTDRLHAHILAALIGIDHVVVENNYGKIGPIVADYSGAFSTVTFVRTSAEAYSALAHAIGEGNGRLK